MSYKPRWGHLRQLDYRTRVGSTAWYANHTPKLRKLSAWRFLHTQRSHAKVSKAAPVSPSSDMSLRQMLTAGKVVPSFAYGSTKHSVAAKRP